MAAKENMMGELAKGTTRREFLKAAGLGAMGTVAAGGLVGSGLGSRFLVPSAQAATTILSLVATDGYVSVPGATDSDPALRPVYVFGFVPVDGNLSIGDLVSTYKGRTHISAPHLNFLQEDDIQITLTNLGLVQRPDLTDSHTIHWHGFDVPTPLFDGVPEVSVAVPIGKQLTYFYRPHREGTYMYHCHFEDVEHVQMGMTGIVFVRPVQDKTAGAWGPLSRQGGNTDPSAPLGYAYNDGNGSTAYDRHFVILLNEIWKAGYHDGDRDIQESVHTDYDPEWFTLNGRCYPDTIAPNEDSRQGTAAVGTWSNSGSPSSPVTASSGITTFNPNYGVSEATQPNSSLIQANPGERILLRLADLGYQQHAMELPGLQMHVVGQDASLLRDGAVDTSYMTNTIYIGPGEARDVLFTAPTYDGTLESGSDARGNYNVYYFKNRDWRKLANNGRSVYGDGAGRGGMMTEVRVYQNPLDPQDYVSQTYV